MAQQSLCDEVARSVLTAKDDLNYVDTNGVVKQFDLLPNNNVCGAGGATECYGRSPDDANSDDPSSFGGGGKDDSQDSLESMTSSTSQNSEYKASAVLEVSTPAVVWSPNLNGNHSHQAFRFGDQTTPGVDTSKTDDAVTHRQDILCTVVYPSVMQNDSSSISELPSTSPKDISDGAAIEKRVQYNAVVNNGVVERGKVGGRKKNANSGRGRPRKAIVAMYHSQISGDKNTIKIRIKKSNLSTQLTPNKKKSGRRKKHKTSDTDASDHETNSKRSKSSVSNDVINETDSFGPLENSRWGTDLPDEILHYIFQLVVGNDGALPILVRLCKVCRQWREIALSPSLWKKVDLNWVTERARTDLTLHWMIQNRLTMCHDLNLGEWKVRDIQLALEALCQYCPELRGLNLSGWKGLNADNLKYITTECEKLQRIDLSSINSTSAINAQPLVNLGQTMSSRLTHLVLAHNKIAGFTQIMASIAANCPNLELLDISNIRTFAHNTALLHIEKLQIGCPKLRVLRITNSQIWLAPASIQIRIQSPGFPCLEELSLAGIEDDQTTTARCVDDDGIERILKNSTKLRLLDVRGCIRLTDSGLVKVPAWDLEHLFLSACYITRTQYSGMELIVQKWSHSLLEVDLAWSTATSSLDAAVMALAEKGSESPLRTINLCGSSVSLEPVKAILTKCPNLHSINLQSCRALPRGIKRLYTGKAVVELRQSLQDKPKTEHSEPEADQQPSTEQPAP